MMSKFSYNQLAQISALNSLLSSTMGSVLPNFLCLSPSATSASLVNLVALTACRARAVTFCMKHQLIPLEVLKLFALFVRSLHHSKRIVNLWSSELCHQYRHYQVCLRILSASLVSSGQQGEVVFRSWSHEAAYVTEFLWATALPSLLVWTRRRVKNECRSGKLTCLGTGTLPENVVNVLDNGPKFCTEVIDNPVELLSMVRNVANSVELDDQNRVLSEGIDCLLARRPRSNASLQVRDTVKFLQKSNLALLLSDKEGGFVVLPKAVFSEKAEQAVSKNFKPVKCSWRELRKKALALCDEMNMLSLKKTIGSAKKDFLDLFFSVKTHKEGMPFRTIVIEQHSWQGALSRFLQKHLKLLQVNDPYLVDISESVLDYLSKFEYPQQPLHLFYRCCISVLFYPTKPTFMRCSRKHR
ncbi:uncharacterized protein LOC125947072 [Dermacentor silvarum]|uniref:uncharacterized protein LOC125947072 n=1 Tax=Dermacentor silvarum TaxID=543639 RepID=UPI00210126F1|nr:uncharacterized protein LOC125947072 [Dermacentor silvarum]